MSIAKSLIELFKYKKRLVYFASQFLGESEWSESFAMEALDKARGMDPGEQKNFLYQEVRDSCLKYLRVFDGEKELTSEQIEQFFFKAELMQDLTQNK